MSGHSKWAQIKHKKAATDQKKGALFSKIANEISIAARSGGADPSANTRLRAAIERARSFGLPKDNIERALERASGAGASSALHEFLYEALADDGVQILVEGISDNTNRSHAEIKKILTDRGAKFADPGSVMWNFEKRGCFFVGAGENQKKTSDEIELLFIDAGVEQYIKEDDSWLVWSLPGETERARGALASSGVLSEEAHYVYRVKNEITPPAEARESLSALLQELSRHPDVHGVYTNTDVDAHT